MQSSESYLEVLRELGLTKYEAKVFLTLYTFGAMTPTELSERSGVPQSWIYTVLKSLSQKGWVESIQGRPSLIKPIAVNALLPRIRRQLSEGLERKLTLIRELGSHMGEASEAISALVYYGEEQVAKKASQILSNSPKCLAVLDAYWVRRLKVSGDTRILSGSKSFNLIVLKDAVFWFPTKSGLPIMGVLAYSKSLARRVSQFVERKKELGQLKPLVAGRPTPGGDGTLRQ